MLTEMRKTDRETMAAMVEDLCRKHGATVSRVDADRRGPQELVLEIRMGELRVTVDFDGSKGVAEERDVYCMPWNTLLGSPARMTDEFGAAVGAPVNIHHRAKCTGFAGGIDDLLARLDAAFACIDAGKAWDGQLAKAA